MHIAVECSIAHNISVRFSHKNSVFTYTACVRRHDVRLYYNSHPICKSKASSDELRSL